MIKIDEFNLKNPKNLKSFDQIIIGFYIDDEKVFTLDWFKSYVNDSQIECIVNNDIIDEWYSYDEKLWNKLKNVIIKPDYDNDFNESLNEEIDKPFDFDARIEYIDGLIKNSSIIKQWQETNNQSYNLILQILNELDKIKEDLEIIKNNTTLFTPFVQPYKPIEPYKPIDIYYNKENSAPPKYNWKNEWVYDPGPYCSSTITDNCSTTITTDNANNEVSAVLPTLNESIIQSMSKEIAAQISNEILNRLQLNAKNN